MLPLQLSTNWTQFITVLSSSLIPSVGLITVNCTLCFHGLHPTSDDKDTGYFTSIRPFWKNCSVLSPANSGSNSRSSHRLLFFVPDPHTAWENCLFLSCSSLYKTKLSKHVTEDCACYSWADFEPGDSLGWTLNHHIGVGISWFFL